MGFGFAGLLFLGMTFFCGFLKGFSSGSFVFSGSFLMFVTKMKGGGVVWMSMFFVFGGFNRKQRSRPEASSGCLKFPVVCVGFVGKNQTQNR